MRIFKIINWRNVSFFGQNKIINRSYIYLFIVPMLAKLLSKISSPINLNIGGHQFDLVFELPFSWKLFFLSALLFTIGSIFYSLFSPTIIKENKSYGDFLEHKKNFGHIIDYLNSIGITDSWLTMVGISVTDARERNFDNTIGHFEYSKFNFLNRIAQKRIKLYYDTFLDKADYSSTRDYHQEYAFWRLYNYSNNCKPILLFLTTLFYIGGLTLISIVIVQGLLLVIK